MNFGEALEAVKEGRKIAREGWNGKGMYVYYVPANKYEAITEAAKEEFGNNMVPYNPYFAIKNVNNTISTWVPSVNDCLADDWYVLESKNNTYITKTVKVQARKWTGTLDVEMYNFLTNKNIKSSYKIQSTGKNFKLSEDNYLRVWTKLSGFMTVSIGDFIVKKTEESDYCYIYRPEDFEEWYEKE